MEMLWQVRVYEGYDLVEQSEFYKDKEKAKQDFEETITRYKNDRPEEDADIVLFKIVIPPKELEEFATYYDTKLGHYFEKKVESKKVEGYEKEMLYYKYEDILDNLIGEIFDLDWSDTDNPIRVFRANKIKELKEVVKQLEEDISQICEQMKKKNLGNCEGV